MKYVNEIRSRLINWGKVNKDDFPWRNPESLYESVVAEIMLIRTPAEQVLPVYNKFISKFSGPEELTKASIDEIEKEIRELGLIWRAKRLKDMGLYFINNEISDKINLSIEELKQIPGVGDYASSAIFTFYYSKRSVPVDSNTVRFIERFYAREFKGEARRNKELYNIINEIIPDKDDRAVKFNESFLDFMRKVCQPRDPNCVSCSLRDVCSYPVI